jgi:hypothetical protein
MKYLWSVLAWIMGEVCLAVANYAPDIIAAVHATGPLGKSLTVGLRFFGVLFTIFFLIDRLPGLRWLVSKLGLWVTMAVPVWSACVMTAITLSILYPSELWQIMSPVWRYSIFAAGSIITSQFIWFSVYFTKTILE